MTRLEETQRTAQGSTVSTSMQRVMGGVKCRCHGPSSSGAVITVIAARRSFVVPPSLLRCSLTAQVKLRVGGGCECEQSEGQQHEEEQQRGDGRGREREEETGPRADWPERWRRCASGVGVCPRVCRRAIWACECIRRCWSGRRDSGPHADETQAQRRRVHPLVGRSADRGGSGSRAVERERCLCAPQLHAHAMQCNAAAR